MYVFNFNNFRFPINFGDVIYVIKANMLEILSNLKCNKFNLGIIVTLTL